MIRILVDKNNLVKMTGSICELDHWEDEPEIKKWKIEENIYCLDFGFTVYSVESLPDDFVAGNKYLYIDGEFIKNPDYKPRPLPTEVRVEKLENELVEQSEINTALEEALVEQYEANLALEEELVTTQLILTDLYEQMLNNGNIE